MLRRNDGEPFQRFKLAPTAAELPAQGTFVLLNIDGTNLPSDWYPAAGLRGDADVARGFTGHTGEAE